jgi:hypothetical protein
LAHIIMDSPRRHRGTENNFGFGILSSLPYRKVVF